MPRVLCAIGGCFFLLSFFIHHEDGKGRALGLTGITIFMVGIAVNMLYHVLRDQAHPQTTRHLISQTVLCFLIAIASLCLAVYLYQHGNLPTFMRSRYK